MKGKHLVLIIFIVFIVLFLFLSTSIKQGQNSSKFRVDLEKNIVNNRDSVRSISKLRDKNISHQKLVFKTINCSSINVEPVILVKNPDLIITGDYLIVIEPANKQLFLVFKLPDCRYLGGFGEKGKGPKEFGFLVPFSATPTPDGFEIIDVTKGFLDINLKKFNNDNEFVVTNVVRIPGKLMPLNDGFRLNDSIICGLPYSNSSSKPYIRYNTRTNKIDYFGEYPTIYPIERKNIYWEIYTRRTVIKQDRSLFASFCSQVKMLQVYKNDGNLEKEVILDTQKDLFEGDWIKKNPIIYYRLVKATDKYIYALCENKNSSELSENIPILEIWDWKANLVTTLKLDKPISAFDVTDDNKYIYGIDWQTEDCIFLYDISKENL